MYKSRNGSCMISCCHTTVLSCCLGAGCVQEQELELHDLLLSYHCTVLLPRSGCVQEQEWELYDLLLSYHCTVLLPRSGMCTRRSRSGSCVSCVCWTAWPRTARTCGWTWRRGTPGPAPPYRRRRPSSRLSPRPSLIFSSRDDVIL
jgi:hypothetical protein